MEAKRLPTHHGPAAWSAILGHQDPPQSLQTDSFADIAVVGAGFAGLSAARRLLQIENRLQVSVLDAGRVAEGAAGRNSGFMIDLPHDIASDDYSGKSLQGDRKQIALNRMAIRFADESVEEYGIDDNYFDKSGKINGAASDRAHQRNLSYAENLISLDEPHEVLDRKQMQEWIGSSHYQSGLYTPGTVMLQPAGYIRSFARGLERNGVKIYENSPVQIIERSGSLWKLTTPKGTISAERVILAVNGQLESFGLMRHRLMHIFLYASLTAEIDPQTLRTLGGRPRWGLTPSDPMGTSMRRIDTAQGGNRILTRTCASFRPNMVVNDRDIARATRIHLKKFAQRFPELAGIKQEFTWAGHLCLTRNAVAVMREIEQNMFAACVQNGLGTVRGTLTGIGAAELACGISSPVTEHFTSEPGPVRLPPEPLAAWGANVWLRFREWQAREE
ncbi:MAG: FAD-binding oxidoreductase [Gammaproteobacteria bacterium]|nr:FAD-binding oxidoreductase [Gammaproteobacteria bacterium]